MEQPFYVNNSYRFAIINTSTRLLIECGDSIRINNIGPENAYFWLGNSTVVADNTKVCLMPGACEIFTRNTPYSNNTYIAAIAETAATILSIQTGEGN